MAHSGEGVLQTLHSGPEVNGVGLDGLSVVDVVATAPNRSAPTELLASQYLPAAKPCPKNLEQG